MRGFPIPFLLALILALPAAADTAPPVTLGPGTMGWDRGRITLTAPPDPAPLTRLPVIDPQAEGTEAALLRRLWARGEAAGLAGVIYDNRDRGHSALPPGAFPQLSPLRYGDLLRAQGLDYGLAGPVALPGIVLGNSSTAVTAGPMARSLPRLAMTAPGGAAAACAGYLENRLYIYPEHRDHDAVDLFPANLPCLVISQGSSGSDQPFLRALALTLGAFRPETRARLEAEGLVAPALQMILRRARSGEVAYLTGAAHPTAFDADSLKPGRMLALAQAMAPGEVPPLVRIRVESEDFATEAGPARRSEHLFDTPVAVARVWRGPDYRREMIVSAAETADPNGRPLAFSWVLLRGDPARVRIEPLGDGRRARIAIDWHEPFPVARIGGRMTARVDIAIFADNGAQISAPAILSVSFPAHEVRRYAPGEGGTMVLREIDYDALGRGVDFDPALHVSAPWRDTFRSAPDGSPAGLDRVLATGARRFVLPDVPAPAPEVRTRNGLPELAPPGSD